MKKTTFLISAIVLSLVVFSPALALTFSNPLASDDMVAILNNIWKFIFSLAIAVVPLMAIIAAFMFMTAGGSPEKIKKARDLLIWLVVGVAIVLLAGGIVGIIKKILGVG